MTGQPFEHDAVQLACDLGTPPDLDPFGSDADDDWELRHIEG